MYFDDKAINKKRTQWFTVSAVCRDVIINAEMSHCDNNRPTKKGRRGFDFESFINNVRGVRSHCKTWHP